MKINDSALKHGIAPEKVVLIFDSGNELVIHAMKARTGMIDLLP